MGTNNDYTTGNLSDYEYFSNNYKIELENFDLKQQINFTGILEENRATFEFSQNAVIVV